MESYGYLWYLSLSVEKFSALSVFQKPLRAQNSGSALVDPCSLDCCSMISHSKHKHKRSSAQNVVNWSPCWNMSSFHENYPKITQFQQSLRPSRHGSWHSLGDHGEADRAGTRQELQRRATKCQRSPAVSNEKWKSQDSKNTLELSHINKMFLYMSNLSIRLSISKAKSRQ